MPTQKRASAAGADQRSGITAGGAGAPRSGPRNDGNWPAVRLTVAECYSVARQARGGGFLYTEMVSDRLGTAVAAVGMRLGVHPTYLTLVNLILGIGGSVAVIAGRSADRVTPLVAAGAVLWQVAYIFDCADGQLARATGKTSIYGGSVDVFADVAVQISVVAAVSSIILSRHEAPALLLVIFASAWYLNFVTFLLAKGQDQASHSLATRRSALVSVAKLLRDYGFVILLLGAWLLASPSTLLVPVMAVTAMNLLLLAAWTARAARLSIRVSASSQTADHAPRDGSSHA